MNPKFYENLDEVLLRTPRMSIESCRKYFRDSRSLLQAWKDKEFQRALPAELRQKIAEAPEKFEDVIGRYVLRMATHPVPRGRWAGITVGKVDSEDRCRLLGTQSDRVAQRETIDSRLNRLLSTDARLNLKTLIYSANPSLNQIDNKVSFHKRVGEHYVFTKAELPAWCSAVLKLRDVSWPVLLRTIRGATGVSRTEAEKIVRYLLREQLLLCSYVHESSSLDPSVISQEDALQENLFRPASECAISQKSADHLIKACAIATKLDFNRRRARRELSSLRRFYHSFMTRYGRNEVPILEALNPVSGIGFDHENTAIASDSPDFDQAMMDLWQEQRVHETRELVLSDQDIDRISAIDPQEFNRTRQQSPSFTIYGSVVHRKNQSPYYLFDFAIGISAVRPLVRFANDFPEISRLTQKIAKLEQERMPRHLFADIAHLPNPGKITNIAPLTELYEGRISVSTQPHKTSETVIPLNDLMVSAWSGGIRLRSKSLNKEVYPILATMHVSQADSHPAYRFLCSIAHQLGYDLLDWSWGAALSKNNFLPRVRYKNIILQPASWRMGAAETAKLREKPSLKAVTAWRRAHGIPRFVYIQAQGKRLSFDLENELMAKIFAGCLDKNGSSWIREDLGSPFNPENEHWVRDKKGNRYTHDVLIPMIRKTKIDRNFINSALLAKKQIPDQDRELRRIAPGGFCLYLKIFLKPERQDAYLAESVAPWIQDLKKAGALDRWHFVKYVDGEGPQLRLRIFAKPSQIQTKILPDALKRLQKHIRSGKVESFCIDTYDREIVRYGGVKGTNLFEMLSEIECENFLDAFGGSRPGSSSAIPEEKRYFAYYLLSLSHYLDLFYAADAQKLDCLRDTPFVLRGKLDPKIQGFFEWSMQADPNSAAAQWIAHVRSVLKKRLPDQRRLMKKLDALIKQDEFGVEYKEFVQSVLHLCLIRANPQFGGPNESQLYRCCELALLSTRRGDLKA